MIFVCRGSTTYTDIRTCHDLMLRLDLQNVQNSTKGQKTKTLDPSKSTTAESGDQNHTDAQNKKSETNQNVNKELGAKNSNVGGRPTRSTRNPKPIYVDSIATSGPPPHPGFSAYPKAWSATPSEIQAINMSIVGSRST